MGESGGPIHGVLQTPWGGLPRDWDLETLILSVKNGLAYSEGFNHKILN